MVTLDTHLWTTADAAAFLQVHPNTVRGMVHRGTLPAVKVGEQMRFRPEALDAWVNESDWYGHKRLAA